MRLFDLFLRRSGITRNRCINRISTISHFSIVCADKSINNLREQICLDFSEAGLNITKFTIHRSQEKGLAAAYITVNYPIKLRSKLDLQTKILRNNPNVNYIQFGNLDLECS
ncbi:MAG: hypothetical protein IR526_01830 [Bordetella sp.]|nr:MAG: hypothetical protein IR526_01830 [Bordetella sp.]